MDNVTINIRDLLMRIFLKWRLILVCMVLGAVVLNFFGVYRAQKSLSAYQPTANVTMDSLARKLTEEELETALDNRALYVGHYNAAADARDYLSHSVKMNLDPSAVPTMRIKVLVKMEDLTNIPAVLVSAADRIKSGDVLKETARILGDVKNPAYADELIQVLEHSPAKDVPGNILDIRVIARSEEECRSITELLLAKLEEITPELRDICGRFTFQLLSTEYSEVADPELLLSMQKSVINANDAQAAYTKFAGTLTADQLAYLDALEHGLDKTVEQTEAPAGSSHVSLVRPKYILVGVVLGAFCAVAYVFCALIFGGKMISSEELSESNGTHSLGTLRVSRKPRGLDRWLYRIFGRDSDKYTPEESLEMVLAGIRIAAGKNGWNNVFLTSSSNDEETKNTLAMLTEKLKDQIGTVSCGRPVIHDPASMETMSSSDATVLVERVDVSRYADITKTLSLCKQYDIPVIGYVAQV